ncbi:putative glycosyltransferase [Halomicronema hongdechloris C2206]|uniref:Glycosyltransferase n=1 Tax=Halomicronema hongdechloris C2206 TaxID=1641165 RepID=A0A1Z3HMB2_9CYAN|nr:glycosyltransferase [Halomicronema hongdechloris]ASC71443.1 putative glycosyltransferase [Halomicronema hongdechloris C2206]
MSDPPLVSILINNYNYGEFLPQAIDSALQQSYPNLEVIVVDDGSQDDSAAVIKNYQGNIITVLKQNGGQASAFNAGFAASSGEIVCFLDADDFFLPEKVETIIHWFHKFPNIGWIFHELDYVDRDSNLLSVNRKIADFECQRIDLRHILRESGKIPYSIPCATCGLCLRRDVLDQILPMPESRSVTISDNYIKLSALALSPGIILSQRLAAQRIHDRNIYTFRPDATKLSAEISLKTGYYLRERFPEIEKFTDKLFAKGLGTMIGAIGLKGALSLPETNRYLKRFSTWQSLLRVILSRTVFYTLKSSMKKNDPKPGR